MNEPQELKQSTRESYRREGRMDGWMNGRRRRWRQRQRQRRRRLSTKSANGRYGLRGWQAEWLLLLSRLDDHNQRPRFTTSSIHGQRPYEIDTGPIVLTTQTDSKSLVSFTTPSAILLLLLGCLLALFSHVHLAPECAKR
ncbi:hypothetical protein AB6A40_003766 [Gnathostoma spinigerum]|uniref:Uncharacterized protein n=1 Tax=Gnathostoma spinigerum TaxID=75299 RepID=A0ABD6EK35_9BILA